MIDGKKRVDALTVEHAQMAAILEEMAPILEGLHGEAGEGPAMLAAGKGLTRLAEIWPGHIHVEETNISAKRLEAVVGAEELTAWLQEMGQHRPEGALPDPVAVPFVLYNLSAEDRATMAQQMPPVVI